MRGGVRTSSQPWVVLLVLSISGAGACNDLTWEDYMEAGYDALQDGRHGEAEEFFLTAAEYAEYFEPDDLRRAATLNNLADLFVIEGRFGEAELLFRGATDVIELALGLDHPDVATQLHAVATFYADQGIDVEAEPLYERAVAIREAGLGRENPVTAESLAGLAASYYRQGFHIEAEPLYQRVLSVMERELAPDNVRLAEVLDEYAGLLRATNRGADAAELEARARQIRDAP